MKAFFYLLGDYFLKVFQSNIKSFFTGIAERGIHERVRYDSKLLFALMFGKRVVILLGSELRIGHPWLIMSCVVWYLFFY